VSRYYFAYGSNMNPARVAQRGLRFDEVRSATIDGVRLTFDKQSREHPHCGHANLAFAPGARTEGVLYRLDSNSEIERMDRFEAAPVNYSRDVVWVHTDDGELAAWTYFANAAVLRAGLRPERMYLNHLLAGRDYLSAAYFDWLSRVACVDD
jgi:cation transport regulator ChaC